LGENGTALRPTVILLGLHSVYVMNDITSTPSFEQTAPGIFDRKHVRSYLWALLGMAAIALFYHVPSLLSAFRTPSMPPMRGGFPAGIGFGPGMIGFDSLWPLWGQLMLPSLAGVGLAIIAGVVVALAARRWEKRGFAKMGILAALAVGLVAILLTNLSHGWELGVVTPIGGVPEILTDAMAITNPLSFITNFNNLQPGLSLHAQTQPPGATLAIYVFYSFLGDAGLVSIGIFLVSALFSVFFIRGIFTRLFDQATSGYISLLFLLLPAVQVYYLANIYALVATAFLGLLYCYLHENAMVRVAGSIFFLLLGTFMSFLFVYSFLFLFLFEVLQSNRAQKRNGLLRGLRSLVGRSQVLVLAAIAVGMVYVALDMFFGFNYIEAFFYASSLENPSGFLLLSDPLTYFATRVEDAMDIAIFFGPVLGVLAFKGFSVMEEKLEDNRASSRTRNLVLAALVALLLLFLTGAPKKGETARICMFIIPVLLMPVAAYLEASVITPKDKAKLLVIVFLQAIVMQLFVYWIW
jgi:hypothetical protein